MHFMTGVIPSFTKLLEPFVKHCVLYNVTAARILGLTRTDGFPLEFYTTDDVMNSALVSAIKVDRLDLADTIEFDGVILTDIGRTVCEMLKMDTADDFTIFESIYNANAKIGRDRLFEMAARYGVTDLLESKWQDAMEIYYE